MATAPAQPTSDPAPQPIPDADTTPPPDRGPQPTESSTPIRRPLGTRILRVAAWLFVGVIFTIASSWGCLLWHSYVGSPGPTIIGSPITLSAWPFNVGERLAPPSDSAEMLGFGYRRLHCTSTQHQTSAGLWVDSQMQSDTLRSEIRALVEDYRAVQSQRPEQRNSDWSNEHDRLPSLLHDKMEELERDMEPATQVDFVAFRRVSGWPLLSMEGRYASKSTSTGTTYLIGEDVSEAGSDRASWRQLYDRGLRWPSNWTTRGSILALPLRPVWPAFAGNSLFWGAIAWGTVRLAIARRTRRRLRMGQCTQCRYPILGLALCPECGTPNPNHQPAEPVQNG